MKNILRTQLISSLISILLVSACQISETTQADSAMDAVPSENDAEQPMNETGGSQAQDYSLAEENTPDLSQPNNSSNTQIPRFAFTHKMMKRIDDNPFSSLAYECRECTFEQWESIVPSEGWSKGPAQIGLFSAQDSELRSYPIVEGQPSAVDFLDEIPGDEYQLIAVNLSGRLVETGPNGIVAEVQVKRDTRLVFKAGTRIHELEDPMGNKFVLFAHQIDPDQWQDSDFQSSDSLAEFTPPNDWTYSNRILEEELVLDSDRSEGVVTVLAIRQVVTSTWEKL